MIGTKDGGRSPFVPVTLEDQQDVVSESNYWKLKYIDSPKLQKNKVKVIKEKYSEQHILAAAKNWQPWNHLGIMGLDGTRKNPIRKDSEVKVAAFLLR
jgi:hypothetical protein